MRTRKAPNVAAGKQGHVEGEELETNRQEGNQTMPSLSGDQQHNNQGFDTRFDLITEHGRISVESDRAYWQNDSLPDRVRLVDSSESHLLLAPVEALTVAEALRAVAVYLLEQQSRELVRHTGPGGPVIEGFGGGL